MLEHQTDSNRSMPVWQHVVEIVDMPNTLFLNSDILNVLLICLHDHTSRKDIAEIF